LPKLLLIETATEICSVGLSSGESLLGTLSAKESYSHTEKITLLIEELMKSYGIAISELDGIAISSGPGSYTALRVGAATAKGICYGSNLPLIKVDTLQSLALGMKTMHAKDGNFRYLPIIDARRMEVYGSLYGEGLDLIEEKSAYILTAERAKKLIGAAEKLIIGGNAAEKSKSIFPEDTTIWMNIGCDASLLFPLALQAFRAKNFVDIAYYKPEYLKPPNITTPRPIWR